MFFVPMVVSRSSSCHHLNQLVRAVDLVFKVNFEYVSFTVSVLILLTTIDHNRFSAFVFLYHHDA